MDAAANAELLSPGLAPLAEPPRGERGLPLIVPLVLYQGREEGLEDGFKEGRREGELIGHREGLYEGELKGRIRTIEGFLNRSVPWSTIEAATGIDEAAFRKLKQHVDADDDGPN